MDEETKQYHFSTLSHAAIGHDFDFPFKIKVYGSENDSKTINIDHDQYLSIIDLLTNTVRVDPVKTELLKACKDAKEITDETLTNFPDDEGLSNLKATLDEAIAKAKGE